MLCLLWVVQVIQIESDNIFPVVINFLNLLHVSPFLASTIREKLFDVRQLRDRNLVVKLLVVWTLILIVLRNCLCVILVCLTILVGLLLLLLELVELELAARATSRQV